MSHSSPTNNSTRPDLDESINVTIAHNPSLITPAAAREFSNPGVDKSPLSLATFSLCAVMLIIGGAVLGNTEGSLFSYTNFVKPNYVRGKAPGVTDDVVMPPKAIVDVYVKKGQSLYSAKCNGCHGADAKGDGANFPSLVGSAWVTGPSERFSQVIMNGLQGPTSTGKVYGAGIMPAQGGGMSPQDLAFVMTFVRNSFGNTVGDVITPEMAQAAMDISAKRAKAGSAVTAEELKEHEKDLPGEKMDPATLIDPITLKVVEAKK
jgi:mono/diheme cytochrome c family protein